MNPHSPSIATRAARGEHLCQILLRDDENIPGKLWSWAVYVNGDVHARGPGSTRKHPLKWYATLPTGSHRIVVRERDHTKTDRHESNTLHFVVSSQSQLVITVSYLEGRIVLSLEA